MDKKALRWKSAVLFVFVLLSMVMLIGVATASLSSAAPESWRNSTYPDPTLTFGAVESSAVSTASLSIFSPVMFLLGFCLLIFSPVLATIAYNNGADGPYVFAALMVAMPLGVGLLMGSGG